MISRILQKCRYPLTALHCSYTVETIDKCEENNNDWKKELHATMRIFPNFITPEEEDSIVKELDPYLKRLRYEFSHWDNVSKRLYVSMWNIFISFVILSSRIIFFYLIKMSIYISRLFMDIEKQSDSNGIKKIQKSLTKFEKRLFHLVLLNLHMFTF